MLQFAHARLDHELMQPKDFILDVYGAFARNIGGWVAIGDLISLLSYLEIEEQAVRSSASRMKRNDLLMAERIDGAAGYSLTKTAQEILQDGDRRIFRDIEDDFASSWIVALFSVPESERQDRYLVRSRLARLGFGQGPASSWFAPAAIQTDTERMLRRTGLDAYVTLWRGDYIGFGNIRDLVEQAWDLEEIQERYQEYLDAFEPIEKKWASDTFDDRTAFVDYVRNLTVWRPLPYLDPGLSSAVTSDAWPGTDARRLFLRLEALLRPQANRFFLSVAGVPSR